MYVVADLKFLTIVIILFKPNFSLEIGPHDVGEVGIRKVGQNVYHPGIETDTNFSIRVRIIRALQIRIRLYPLKI